MTDDQSELILYSKTGINPNSTALITYLTWRQAHGWMSCNRNPFGNVKRSISIGPILRISYRDDRGALLQQWSQSITSSTSPETMTIEYLIAYLLHSELLEASCYSSIHHWHGYLTQNQTFHLRMSIEANYQYQHDDSRLIATPRYEGSGNGRSSEKSVGKEWLEPRF